MLEESFGDDYTTSSDCSNSEREDPDHEMEQKMLPRVKIAIKAEQRLVESNCFSSEAGSSEF
jgi:hypothetical protein